MRPRITLAQPMICIRQAGVEISCARFVNKSATVPVPADARALRGRGRCSMLSP